MPRVSRYKDGRNQEHGPLFAFITATCVITTNERDLYSESQTVALDVAARWEKHIVNNYAYLARKGIYVPMLQTYSVCIWNWRVEYESAQVTENEVNF